MVGESIDQSTASFDGQTRGSSKARDEWDPISAASKACNCCRSRAVVHPYSASSPTMSVLTRLQSENCSHFRFRFGQQKPTQDGSASTLIC